MRSTACIFRQLSCLVIAFVAFTGFALGQYQERALERARTVKMLTDDRETVRRIFHDFNLDDSDETSDEFSFGETKVEVTYSSGNCEDDGENVWDVAAGRVIGIQIDEDSDAKVSDVRFDLTKLHKEQIFAGDSDRFLLHSKLDGIAFRINEDELRGITVFPSVRSKAKICQSNFARDFINEKSWFGKSNLKDRKIIECYTSDVSNLALSHLEISAVTAKQIEVSISVINPNNDVLTYGYTVSGGRIIGAGPKVKWDLTGVRSGTYTITAGVDDGCGYCGQTKSMTVVVK